MMDTAGLLVFLSSAGLLWSRNLSYAALFLLTDGLALTVMMLVGSLSDADLAIAVATLLIKGVIIPGSVWRVVRQWPAEFRQDYPLPLWAYAIAAILVLGVNHVIHVLTPTHLILHRTLFFYGLASIHLSLLMIVSRRHVLSQVTALIGVENGLVVLAYSVAGSLPIFMELGMLGDLLVAAAILVWMTRRIHQQFKSTDVTALQRLKG
ncbi:MAG: hypothetical protein C7B47_17275 [Sulfobacillus thermosulfidooxidans]|uniref:Hydrogenase-4 component E n=1 Tax=Sulfobacillus thermosulfidooxidans TaxID=28034 RepID=A0A2T2WGZ9_SULTH|nr:MAG: hypothetical protein C7B47_17275 [Sulfobacillus thermosulfidooxidans]